MDKAYTLVIFDVDGTLTETKSGKTFRETASDWQWLPGRLEKLHKLQEQGVQIAVATNQGGVAFGFLKVEDIQSQLFRMCQEAGIRPTRLYVCYTHPKGKIEQYRMVDKRRKPGPGMLLEAMSDFGVSKRSTLYVGDMEDDKLAAKNAGCDFVWASAFFGD